MSSPRRSRSRIFRGAHHAKNARRNPSQEGDFCPVCIVEIGRERLGGKKAVVTDICEFSQSITLDSPANF